MSEALPKRIDIIVERHGKTFHNKNGWISGGGVNPELLPEGEDGARYAGEILKLLKEEKLKEGEESTDANKHLRPDGKPLASDDTPVYSTGRKRAIKTAKLLTGRDNTDWMPEIDDRLLERLLGDWDAVLTERLQREFKKIDRHDNLDGQVYDFLSELPDRIKNHSLENQTEQNINHVANAFNEVANIKITADDISNKDKLQATAELLTAAINRNYPNSEKGLDDLIKDIKEKLPKEENGKLKRPFNLLASPKFILPGEEDGDLHKKHVEESLKEIIRKNNGEPVAIISHGGTSRRLVEYFHMPDDVNIDNSQPYHAYSNDGGKSWTIDQLNIDEHGKLKRTELEAKDALDATKKANAKITLEEILKHNLKKINGEQKPTVTNISLSKKGDKHILTVELGKKTTNNEQAIEVRKALGELLIGKLHNKDKLTKLDGKTITVELNKTQTEILEKFVELKHINLPRQQRATLTL